MKKLLIAVITFASVTSTFAAASIWNIKGGNVFAESTSSKYTGTAYVFDVAKLSQNAVFNAYSANSSYSFANNAAGSVSISEGSFASTSKIEYGTSGNNYSFYFVLVSDDKKALYFSNILSDTSAYEPPLEQNLAFKSQNLSSLGTYSGTARADGFQGAGKWSAVPEPTSGLLLLIGFAGLALRRKQK